MWRAAAAWCVVAAQTLCGAATAQEAIDVQAAVEVPPNLRVQVQSPILTVDSKRLFAESALGRKIIAEIEAAGTELQQQNNRIAAELEAEEQELTAKRAELDAEAFRALADAFDEKAQRIRSERAAELRALNERLEQEERAFLQAAAPVLEAIMREAGAAVVLEEDRTLLSSLAVDVTAIAIGRIDLATQTPAE